MTLPAMTLNVDVEVIAGATVVAATFTAGRGITALIGPSGVGKSLTLAAIAGLVRPRHGSVTFNDVSWSDASTSLHVRTQERRIGMVFQDGALLPHRSARRNVELGLGADVPRTQRAHTADEWLARVGIAHRAASLPPTMSGGERQRVALARALATKPALLLLDEPFSAVDSEARAALRQLVHDIVDEQQLTAVLVTHDAQDIAQLGAAVVRLDDSPRPTV